MHCSFYFFSSKFFPPGNPKRHTERLPTNFSAVEKVTECLTQWGWLALSRCKPWQSVVVLETTGLIIAALQDHRSPAGLVFFN
jgi:hypothetical protein